MSNSKKDGNLSAFQSKAQGVKIERPVVPEEVKPKRKKAIKDTFSFPEGDHALIESLVTDFLKSGVRANKSEVIRAGLHALKALSLKESIEIIGQLERVQVGRPKNV